MPPFTHPLKYPLDNKLPLWQSSTLQHTGICCARQYLSLNSCTSSQAIHGIQPQHKAAGSFQLRFRSTLTQQRGASTAPKDSFAPPLQTTKPTHDARLDASCVRQPSSNKQGTTLHACRQLARCLGAGYKALGTRANKQQQQLHVPQPRPCFCRSRSITGSTVHSARAGKESP
jgi:hypothetical protein